MKTSQLPLAVAAAIVSSFALASAAEFVPLRSIPAGSFFAKGAAAISADGTVVVGVGSSLAPHFENEEAFRWTTATGAQALTGLPIMESTETSATGVSGDGSVIVGNMVTNAATPASNVPPFRLTVADGMTPLQYSNGDALRWGQAQDISANGKIIVGTMENQNRDTEAFIWTNETGAVGISGLPGRDFESGAVGVSADGRVVTGNSNSALGREAFRWTAQTGMTTLGTLPSGLPGFATGISSDGSTIVGWAYLSIDSGVGEGTVAFRWTAADGFQLLGDLPGGQDISFANAVSADGLFVLGQSWALPIEARHNFKAFIWDSAHGMRDLQDLLMTEFGLSAELAGWQLEDAWGISDDGRSIVGGGINPSGIGEAWLVRLEHPLNVPEPEVSLPIILFAILLQGRSRRQQEAKAVVITRRFQPQYIAARSRNNR